MISNLAANLYVWPFLIGQEGVSSPLHGFFFSPGNGNSLPRTIPLINSFTSSESVSNEKKLELEIAVHIEF